MTATRREQYVPQAILVAADNYVLAMTITNELRANDAIDYATFRQESLDAIRKADAEIQRLVRFGGAA